MEIQFVSDVACPWCAVGLHGLERALERLGPGVQVRLRFEPFELNPDLAPEGVEAAAYLRRKYGLSQDQLEATRQHLRERGQAVGFRFGQREHVWNTFDAHRLLHWAGLQGRQRELKLALLQAYHGDGRNPSAPEVLADCARQAGLDAAEAADVIGSARYADEVRAAEAQVLARGIHAVPSMIIDGRHLIQGAQPPEALEQALRQLAAEA